MTTVLMDIENQLTLCSSSLSAIAGYVTHSDQLSEKGKADSWEKYTKHHAKFVGQMKAVLDTVMKGVEKETELVLADQMPQATSPAEITVAELQASRILSRNLKGFNAINAWYQTAPVSPARTIVVEELKGRGQISDDEFLAMITNSAEDYRRAVNKERLVGGAIYHFLKPRIAELEKRLKDMHRSANTELLHSVSKLQVELDALELATTPQVPAWKPEHIDHFLAKNPV